MTAEDAVSHVDEMVTVYEGEELETTQLGHVMSAVMKNRMTYVEEGERLKSIIKALIEDFEHEKEGGDEIKKSGQIDSQLEKIEEENKKAKDLDTELQSQISQISQKQEQIQREIQEVNSKHRETLASLRQGDLYNTVSQIRWQKDDASPEMVKGIVVNKSGIKPFSLDSNQQSKNFICNYVWGLMKADW